MSMNARTVVFLGVLVLIAVLTVIYGEQIIIAFRDHFPALIYAVIITVIALALQSYNFLQLVGKSVKVPYMHALHTWAVANLANYLGPFQPGLAVRALYFKRIGVPLLTTTRATLRQLILSVWVASGLCVVGLFNANPGIRYFAICGVAGFICMPLVLRLLRSCFPGDGSESRLAGFIRKILDLGKIGMPAYKLWPFIIQYMLMALCFYAVYNVFGVQMKFDEATLLAVIFALSALFSITPNNLGMQELLLGYVAHMGGLSGGVAFSVALVFRVAHFLACIIVIGVTYRSMLQVPGAEK